MPTYTSKCKTCGEIREFYRPISRYDDMPECCGERTEKVITVPAMIAPDIQPYRSMVTGEYIGTRAKHRQHLKDTGCIELGNEQVKKRESYVDKKREKEALRREIGERMSAAGL